MHNKGRWWHETLTQDIDTWNIEVWWHETLTRFWNYLITISCYSAVLRTKFNKERTVADLCLWVAARSDVSQLPQRPCPQGTHTPHPGSAVCVLPQADPGGLPWQHEGKPWPCQCPRRAMVESWCHSSAIQSSSVTVPWPPGLEV